MILHTINKSSTHQALGLCLRLAANDDIIVLLEDGVCNAVKNTQACRELSNASVKQIYVLLPDLLARGLHSQCDPCIEVIDYPAFVALCCACDKVQSWF
jgi:sulfur relay protein TusB/DsrH